MLRQLQALLALGASAFAVPAAAQEPIDDDSSDSAYEPADDESKEENPGAENPGAENPGAENPKETGPPEVPAGSSDEASHEVGASFGKWKIGIGGYFRAPMAFAISNRPGPDDLTGRPERQISFGPNRTVDANYFSFAYTRLQEQDWVELFIRAKRNHVEATIGWMGYWYASAGFRNPDAAWVPGIAYLTLDTDFKVGRVKPNIALSAGAWWPHFGRFAKYDTFTLGQFRHLGGQLKLAVPFGDKSNITLWQGVGTGRDGSFAYLAPPFYNTRVGLNLLYYAHLGFKFKDWVEAGIHYNTQWTRDPNLLDQTGEYKTYTRAKDAGLMTIGGEVTVRAPYAGSLWVSPSYIVIKNGWALGSAGIEAVHGLSPAGLAVNYLSWSGSPADSTGSGNLFNLGFLYENKLSNVLKKPAGGNHELTLNLFGLLVDAVLDRPDGSQVTQNKLTQFKWGADVEYNPVRWFGLMARWDQVNYDLHNPGYVFSAITARLSFYTHYLSGERIYIQYSRYQYGDHMTLAGTWPWGVPLVAGSDIIQDSVYVNSKPDMDVIKLQADIRF